MSGGKGWGGARKGAGRKSAAAKKTEQTQIAKAEAAARPKMRVSQALLDYARGVSKQRVNPFQPAQFPPAAIPKNVPRNRLAMDSAFSNPAIDWAGSVIGQVFSEGLTFLGYPLLAEMAQRPEYRVISETISMEMTRKWIRIQSRAEHGEAEEDRLRDKSERDKRRGLDKEVEDDLERDAKSKMPSDKSEKIAMVEDDMTRLRVRDTFSDLSLYDGFFGRSHLFFDFGTGTEPGNAELATPVGDGTFGNLLSKTKVAKGSLKRLKMIEPVWTYPQAYNADNPLNEDWYAPTTWYVMGRQVHVSRLIPFVGRPVPDLLKPAYSFGGLAMSQMAKPYVDNWLRTRQSVSDLVHAFSVMAFSTDMDTILNAGGEEMEARAAAFAFMRDNKGLWMIDKNKEDVKNVAAPLGTLDTLQAQTMEHMATVAKMPIIKLFGDQPQGLNASSDGAIRSFYDNIHGGQEKFFRPGLTSTIGFVQLNLFGAIDPDLVFEFEPLWALTEKEMAEVRKINADTAQIHIDSGVLHPEEERKRVAEDPDTLYHGLDVSDVPELAEEEEEGLEPVGGRPQNAKPEKKEPGAEDADLPFAEDSPWEESKHPRDKDGKFGSGGGGSSGGAAEKKKKTAFGGLWKVPAGKSADSPEAIKLNADNVLGKPANAGQSYRQMLSHLIHSAGKIANPEHYKKQLKLKLAVALYKASEKAMESAQPDAVLKIDKVLKTLPEALKNEAFDAYVEETKADKGKQAKKPASEPANPPAPAKAESASPDDKKKAYAQLAQQTFGKSMSALEKGKEYVKSAVQTGAGIEAAVSSMNDAQKSAMAKQYGSIANAYSKAEGYWNAQKVQEEQQAKAKAAAEKAEKEFEAAMNSPEAKAHYAALKEIVSGGGASDLVKTAKARLAASGLKGVSPAAAAHIVAYSGSFYREVNQQLRMGVMTPEQYGFARSLNDALDQLPAYKQVTYRKASLDEAHVAANYKPGMIVEQRGFTSSSKKQGTWSGNVQYEIHGKSGRDIQKLSSHSGEAEVLFKSGTRFLVKSRAGNNIVLEEV